MFEAPSYELGSCAEYRGEEIKPAEQLSHSALSRLLHPSGVNELRRRRPAAAAAFSRSHQPPRSSRDGLCFQNMSPNESFLPDGVLVRYRVMGRSVTRVPEMDNGEGARTADPPNRGLEMSVSGWGNGSLG